MQPHTAKHHLKSNHWTQQEAAEALNVTLSYLNRVLNGELKSRRLLEAVMLLTPKGSKKKPVYERRAA